MNILYICAYPDNVTGGVQSVVPLYLKYMSRVTDVYVFSCKGLDFRETKERYCQIESKKTLLKVLGKMNIVIFHEVYYVDYYGLARLLVKRDIPYIVIPHCSLTQGAQRQKKCIKKVINKIWVNRFIVQAYRIQYLSLCEWESSKAFQTLPLIIPNGIDTEEVSKKEYKEHHSVEFVFIGRLSIKQKGLDRLIEACSLIKNEMTEKNIHINLYGTDFEGGKHYIQKKIREYRLEEIVKLHAPVYGEDKQRILIGSDVYILTSRFEGLPMGILEAMQVGLPVLVTHGSGFYEVVKRESCGWYAEDTFEDIARVIIKVSDERERWTAKSDNAIRVVNNYYRWDKVAAVAKQEYERLLLLRNSYGAGRRE